MGWSPPISSKPISSESISCKLSSIPLSKRSGPRKTASLSFQERMRNAIKPGDRFKGSNVVSVSDDMESVTGYDSQSTISTDTLNEELIVDESKKYDSKYQSRRNRNRNRRQRKE